MKQYLLIKPNNDLILNADTPIIAAKIAFKKLSKNKNLKQTRLVLKDINDNSIYEYIAMSDNKLNEYKNLYESYNPVQIGGSSQISDNDFYKSLAQISGNLNTTTNEMNKLIRSNDVSETENDEVIFMIKDSVNRMKELNNDVNNLNYKFDKYIDFQPQLQQQLPLQSQSQPQLQPQLQSELPIIQPIIETKVFDQNNPPTKSPFDNTPQTELPIENNESSDVEISDSEKKENIACVIM